MRNYHQFVAESVRPGQSHDLWEETLKARSSIARSKARVLVAIPGARDLAGQDASIAQHCQHLRLGHSPPSHLLGVSQNCLPQLWTTLAAGSGRVTP